MNELPTGTVTFLFTDIEGSTRLLRDLGDSYRPLLEEHAGLIREAIGETGGVEVSTEGDAFFVVFASAVDAITSVAQAQRRLAASEALRGVIRVRMGLHTGEGKLGGDNYVGIDVNRAARISAAAHGGQVLLSAATHSLASPHLKPGLNTVDLGEHRLKDVPSPEHLFQLSIEGLEVDFPPVRSLDKRVDLPEQLTSFVGRAREIEQIADLLGQARLVTLTGPGGTGKTRLALRCATQAGGDFADGVVFVGLASITAPQLVAPTIAEKVGVREEKARPVAETLMENLRARKLLLVLDNFEQVLEAAPLVADVLAKGRGVKALVTSREALGLRGEQEFAVPPLALPGNGGSPSAETLAAYDGVALFVQRARAVLPDFELTDDNAAAVAEICARLDGLPLAIELAAARLKILRPAELAARLGSRLGLLTGGARDLPARHQRLRDTIAWSYDMLGPGEQRLFYRLAGFSGGWALEATEAVAGVPPSEVLDGIASLVSKSLVRRGEAGEVTRFVMLETIREFGLEQLAGSGELMEVESAHARFYTDLAETSAPDLLGADQVVAHMRLSQDLDNFRAALSWAITAMDAPTALRLAAGLRHFWRLGGHVREGRRWLHQVLSLLGAEEPTAARAAALTAAADLDGWAGEPEAYIRHASEAVDIYRSVGDERGNADATLELGAAHMTTGNVVEARRYWGEALELNRDLDDGYQVAMCFMGLGMVAIMEGDLDEAEGLLTDGVAGFTRVGERFFAAFGERWLAHVENKRGDRERARERYSRVIEVFRQTNQLAAVATALEGIAEVLLDGDEGGDRAVRLLGAADALTERAGGAQGFELLHLEPPIDRARQELDATVFDRAWEEGRALSVDDAVALARTRG